ncbi:hypothetical protein C8Q80DRAFT_593645 [Daedaleopsis nitida]|nr:hypothetical protein C8Q80DRAFT_593645 [Daedaleopsis nitida]
MSNGTVSVGYLVNELVISGRANGSCSLAALTCLVYEYALTFPEEVELFWRRGLSGASVLFFSASWAVQVSPFWFFVFNQVLAVLPFLPIAAFSALRVYAFSECCLVPAFAVFVLSCSPFVINLARVQWLTSSPDPVWGCDPSLSAVPPSYIFPLHSSTRPDDRRRCDSHRVHRRCGVQGEDSDERHWSQWSVLPWLATPRRLPILHCAARAQPSPLHPLRITGQRQLHRGRKQRHRLHPTNLEHPRLALPAQPATHGARVIQRLHPRRRERSASAIHGQLCQWEPAF